MARDLGVEYGAPEGGQFAVEDLALMLNIGLNARGKRAIEVRADALVQDMRERLDEVLRGATAFHEGHVYCFHTDSPESPYSHPTNVVDVFRGYSANGKPEWHSFPNVCLARREPRVDRLYGERPEVISFVQMAEELSGELLPSFGRDSLAYSVVGQVVCGLIPRDLDPKGRAERIALTLQIVETTQGTDSHRLRLNVLGLPPSAIAQAAADQDPRSPAEAFRKLLRSARGRVDALARRVQNAAVNTAPLDVTAEARPLLARLSTDIGRVFRGRERTKHAEMRHQSGERPTSEARRDAVDAPDKAFYRDTERDTVVVVGPRGRAHVFTYAGKHVTSLALDPGELERKDGLGRWTPLTSSAREAVRKTLRKVGDRDQSWADANPDGDEEARR
ncbi:MAG: hypothetical protein ACI9MR_005029 [Myxococcota bacterium]